MDLNWRLNESNFTILDRLKICSFFLNPSNRWTQGDYVRKYEEGWSSYTNAKYVLMTSSGSTANTCIAQYSKVKNPRKNIAVFPAVTWQTSVSPWVNFGFTPEFVDINLEDFSMDLQELETLLAEKSSKINTVFLTSLIGITPDIERAKSICEKYKVDLKLDNCENTFGSYNGKHICSELPSSTSLYFGHQTTTGSEGGLIFTNDKEEFTHHILNRGHGLTRELSNYEEVRGEVSNLNNDRVDSLFDFYSLGSNYRGTNIAAFMGLLDFARINEYEKKRVELYNYFELDIKKFILPIEHKKNKNVPFCLPIILRYPDDALFNKIKSKIQKLNIEYRPVISGNLLRQTCYKQFDDYRRFKNAEHIHKYGFYVGLHPRIPKGNVKRLANTINNL